MTQPSPRRTAGELLPWIVAVVALAGTVWVGAGLSGIRESVATLIEQELVMPQQHETSWRSAGGLTHTVVTPRNPGEGSDAWAARHKEGVDALLALYPAVGG